MQEGQPSPAALALIKPAADTGIPFEPAVAQRVAADVDGYPYFIQKYGEALWDAADAANLEAITAKLYAITCARVQDALDAEFFENRCLDAALTSSRCELPPTSVASSSRSRDWPHSSKAATLTLLSRASTGL